MAGCIRVFVDEFWRWYVHSSISFTASSMVSDVKDPMGVSDSSRMYCVCAFSSDSDLGDVIGKVPFVDIGSSSPISILPALEDVYFL